MSTTNSSRRLSVVIPCYKQAGFLAAAIESALAQVDANVEVIVVDDGSPDETAEVASRFGDQIVYVHQGNAGVAAARNTGLARATCEWVHFLDADDCLLPTMARTHLDVLNDGTGDVTCSGWQTIDVHGTVRAEYPAPAFQPDAFHALIPVNLAPPVCYVFRRSLVVKVGGFDLNRAMAGHADWDLLLRLASAGARFRSLPAVLVSYRTHDGSMSSQYAKMYDSGMLLLKKAYAAHPHCERCGRRWSDAYRTFQTDYADHELRPALAWGIFDPRSRLVWRHFFPAALSHPSLVFRAATWLMLYAKQRRQRLSGRQLTFTR